MALSDPYATVAQYVAEVTKSDSSDNARIAAHLLAMSRVLDSELGRCFNKDDTAVARYFNAEERGYDYERCGYLRSLEVDDIADGEDLVIAIDTGRDGTYATTLEASDYQLRPRNALVQAEPRPYTEIFLPGYTGATRGAWLPGEDLRITAKWGWPSVPQAIVTACIQLTAILRMESPRASQQMSAPNMVVRTSKEAQDIIDRLMQPYGKTAGIAIG